MTQAIGTAHVPPTTETTHRIPIVGLPACPAWCDGTCVGGVTHKFDGVSIDTDRLHERYLAQMVVDDGDSTRDRQDVRLFIERLDTLDPGEPATVTRVLLDLDRHDAPRISDIDVDKVLDGVGDRAVRSIAAQTFVGSTGPRRVALTSAELRHLAQSALEAADLLDAATAIERR